LRERLLVEILLEDTQPVARADLATKMSLSESTIRDLIKDVSQNSDKHGFKIQLIKGKGYIIQVEDKALLERYLENEESVDVYNQEQRLEALIFYILQSNRYITIGELIDRMQLSRSTIVRDLKIIEKILSESRLKLIKKAHYGLKVVGQEQDFRKAFSKYVLNSTLYLEPTKNYKEFLERIENKELEDILTQALKESCLEISDVAFENVLTHLKILLYRVEQRNFITKADFTKDKVPKVYMDVAMSINNWIKRKFDILLPGEELRYLSTHISARTSTAMLDIKEREKLRREIKNILQKLDQEFLTDFENDNELIEALVIHMHPLIKRLYFNLQLENPLIEEIYIKYTNVFVVSYSFAENIKEKYGYCLTRDEIGYIALHFATHFERINNKSIERIKRIVVICATGGGSAHLIRLKLESVFPNAVVLTTSSVNADQFKTELPDIFLSTIFMDKEIYGVPVLQIKQFLDEREIRKIKEIAALHILKKPVKSNQLLRIQSLFFKEIFQKTDETNYLEIIKTQADKMIELNLAEQDFTDLVLERESKFTTIYQNGIAGPHPMKLNAKEDVIGVTILKNPIEWNGKIVRMIFLINVKKGHLFMHKEISALLLYLMENQEARDRIIKSDSFEEFLMEIGRCLN